MHQLLGYADDVDLLGENISTITKKTEASSKGVGLVQRKVSIFFYVASPECVAESQFLKDTL